MKEYIVLPRLKIVQKAADTTLLADYRPGDMILTPAKVTLAVVDKVDREAKRGASVYFTPLLFFPEWVTWNPIEMRGTLPAIEYRTQDPKDPVVAKSRDRNSRMEAIINPQDSRQLQVNGKQMFRRHVEHLNFIVMLHEHPVTEPFIVTFARGEHFSGSNFMAILRMRKADPFACVFDLHSAYRPSRGQGDWWGIDTANPSEESGISPWLEQAKYDELREAYEDWKSKHTTVGVQADMSDTSDIDQTESGKETVDTANREM